MHLQTQPHTVANFGEATRIHVPPATERTSSNNSIMSHRLARARTPPTARESMRHAEHGSKAAVHGDAVGGRDPIVEAVESVRNGDRSGSVWRIVAGVRRRLRGGAAR